MPNGGRWGRRGDVGVADRARVVRGVAALVALACFGQLGWWWRHPDVFSSETREVQVVGRAPRPVPFHVGLTYPADRLRRGHALLVEATARVVDNTAAATVTVEVCSPRRPSRIGAVKGDLSRWCRVTAVPGTWLDLAASSYQQLVLSIRPRRPGTVDVQGVELRYHHGWQSGSQVVGPDVRYRVGTPR